MNFENVSWVFGLLYESDFLQKGVAENDFVVMTADQVWTEGIITVIVIATDVGDEMIANALVQLSMPFDNEHRLSDQQTTPTFRTHRNLNEDLAFEFYFSSEFDDGLCRGNNRYQITIIIVKN